MIEVKSILKHNSVFKEKTKTLPRISICHRSAYIIFEHPIKRSMPTEIHYRYRHNLTAHDNREML